MVEYFDVVDEHDQPTGVLTTKAAAHADGTLHRLVAVYVFAADGKLYVQDHKASGMLDHSVGGHVTAGEDYLTAAKRESAEELGLVNQPLEEVYTGLYSDEMFDPHVQTTTQMHQFAIYECHPTADWKFIPNDEVEKIMPEELADVVRQMTTTPGTFTPGFLNTMATYLKVKQLPYAFDLAEIRKNWSRTR